MQEFDAGGIAGTELERTFGAAVADYDMDGRLDVYLNHYHSPDQQRGKQLFQSAGGAKFIHDLSRRHRIGRVGNGVKQSFQATWIDVDRDGWLDSRRERQVVRPDALYRNLGRNFRRCLVRLGSMSGDIQCVQRSGF